MATRRVLAIYWEDASSHDPWAEASEVEKFCAAPCYCVTVGFEVKRDSRAIHVAGSINPNETAAIWKIPRRLVRKVKVLGRIDVPDE